MKISIITVCYNSAACIADCLRSVDAQTWPNMEHLIIDGASSDGTLQVIKRHERSWRRVISEPDKGIYDAMNKGVRLSTGTVIGFINADDFYASADVVHKVAEVLNDPSLDACHGDLCYVDPDDTASVVRYWRSSDFRPGVFLRGWCPAHPTFYVRRNVYERFGAFDLQYKIAADVELMMRFMEVHRIKTRYIPEVLVKMRVGGMSNRSWSNVILQNREILRALKRHGLEPALLPFLAGKLFSRGKQFIPRPT
jgi:glycosyltransferase involved in cell wall biosynthesis